MEDAHIALLKVPHGKPPTSAAIGAARIGLFSSQSKKPPLGNSSRAANRAAGFPNGTAAADAVPARGRAGTFSAGDTGDLFPPQTRPTKDETSTAQKAEPQAGPRRASTGTGGDVRKQALAAAAAAAAAGGGEGEGSGSAGAGWKAVDLLEDAALFGVFDGHGGKAVADFCKERLPG